MLSTKVSIKIQIAVTTKDQIFVDNIDVKPIKTHH
jgi:hypothetical protein